MPRVRKTNDLLIIGTGGHGRELADVARAACDDGAPWTLRGFVDANPARHGREIDGLEVLGDETALADFPGCGVIVGIGSTAVRYRVVRRLGEKQIRWP